MFFLKIVTIFIGAFIGVFLYLLLWNKVFSGEWVAMPFAIEIPFAIIAASMAPMIYATWRIFPSGRGRKNLIYGFLILVVLILYVLVVEKYSFVFPREKWVYNLHPVEPILFTVLAIFLLKGTTKLMKHEA